RHPVLEPETPLAVRLPRAGLPELLHAGDVGRGIPPAPGHPDYRALRAACLPLLTLLPGGRIRRRLRTILESSDHSIDQYPQWSFHRDRFRDVQGKSRL